MSRKLLVVGVLVMVLAVESVQSQSFYALRRERSLLLIAGTGTSTYLGELSNPNDYFDTKPNLTVGLQHPIIDRLNVRAEVSWFRLQGSDSKADDRSRVQRNLSFRSDNFEVSVVGVVNLFSGGRRYYQRPNLNFYGFGGVGLLYFNPTTEYQGDRYALRPLKTELVEYSRFTSVIPLGLGVKFKMGPMFNLSVEGGYRKTFSDYLDDVSTVHVDPASFTDPVAAALSDRRPEVGRPILAAGAQRGNPDSMDGYFLANVKLEYYLPIDFVGGKNSSRNVYKQKRRAAFKSKRPPQRRRR